MINKNCVKSTKETNQGPLCPIQSIVKILLEEVGLESITLASAQWEVTHSIYHMLFPTFLKSLGNVFVGDIIRNKLA